MFELSRQGSHTSVTARSRSGDRLDKLRQAKRSQGVSPPLAAEPQKIEQSAQASGYYNEIAELQNGRLLHRWAEKNPSPPGR